MSKDFAFSTIVYEVERGRARITLNRPEVRNAISFEMFEELNQALWDADRNTEVHAVVLRGAGKGFSSGYDFKNAHGDDVGQDGYRGVAGIDDDAWYLERGQRLRMALFDMHKPVIAQVHGFCLAGGTDLALLCDMVIAAEDATFGFPPARNLGSLPNNMWLYHVGPQWAKRLTLTGDTITGAEAQEIGLVMKAVPMEDLEPEVERLLDRLALIDAELLSANKRVINLGMELMGARTLQRLSAEIDARGHQAPSASRFGDDIRELGVRDAVRKRDKPFGDGRARVRGPERRDEDGNLRD